MHNDPILFETHQWYLVGEVCIIDKQISSIAQTFVLTNFLIFFKVSMYFHIRVVSKFVCKYDNNTL